MKKFCNRCVYYTRRIEGTDCAPCLHDLKYYPYWKPWLKEWIDNKYSEDKNEQ